MWHLEEDYRVYCTLVQGKDLAILWDTGQGKQDLAAYLTERVRTPYLVCNSHGRFSGVYAHPAEWPLLEAHARMTGRDWHAAPLEAGMSADLGGRRVKVVSLAGHTRGSVGLLLEDEGLLLAGDGLNPTLLMLGPEAASFAQLRTTLEAVEQLPFERYLASHAPRPIAKAQVGVHLRHLDQIRWEDPSHPGPYGPRVGRSLYKEKGGRSVILFDRGLLEREP